MSTSCGGDDPLSSFLRDGPPTADACTSSSSASVRTSRSSQRVLPLSPPTQNEAHTTRSAKNDRETVTTAETPQERASRLLAMCDERGVGTNTGDEIPKRPDIVQLLGSCVNNNENSLEGNDAEDALFSESVASDAGDFSAQDTVDALLCSNDRMEGEIQKLRALLTKRTLVLEAEKSKMISELSHIRDGHREELAQSQQIVADLMSRMEHLKRSIKDQREMCDALTVENQQLRLENHHLRMKQSDGDRCDRNNPSDVNATGYGWLSRWGGGKKVEHAVSSAPFFESALGAELHGLDTTQKSTDECDSNGSEGSSSTTSTRELRKNANLMIHKNIYAKTNTGGKKSKMPPPFWDNEVKEDDDDPQSQAATEAHDHSDLGGLVGGLVQSTRSLLSTWDDGIHPRGTEDVGD